MEGLARSSALLFESDADDERLRITCALEPDGALTITQVSDGALTDWCFEETPHVIEVFVPAEGVADLARSFGLDGAHQLLATLQMRFAGYDAARKIRAHLRQEDIAYRVRENRVAR